MNININIIFKSIGIVLILLIFALGMSILVTDQFEYIPQNMRWIFALLIMLYALMRLSITITKWNKKDE